MKDNRFISPPGALKDTGKKALVTEQDDIDAEQTIDTIAKEMNLTRIDDTTAEIIRAKNKSHSNPSATAQH